MTPAELAAIVARDAEIDSGDGFSVMPFVSVAEHDVRALLVLLRETREALAIIAAAPDPALDDEHASVLIRRRNIARIALKPLAALERP